MSPSISQPTANNNPSTSQQLPPNPLLPPFQTPTFDPTAYLNATLPPLAIPTPSQPIIPAKHAMLATLTTQTQSHLAQLSALSARLTETLTTLTDEILRSGARLAYDVELLRGEASALSMSLSEGLKEEVEDFVPGGLGGLSLNEVGAEPREAKSERRDADREPGSNRTLVSGQNGEPTSNSSAEPEALTRLRTLHLIRSRLTAVTQLFDSALSWPLPPSLLSTHASNPTNTNFNPADPSMPAPTLPSAETQEAEKKGQEALKRFKDEIEEMLSSRDVEGLERAEKRVGELRELCGVWKGTREEKVRLRFVEGLERRVEEVGRGIRPKGDASGKIEGEKGGRRRSVDGGIGIEGRREDSRERERERGGKGLFGGLRRLREEIYLE